MGWVRRGGAGVLVVASSLLLTSAVGAVDCGVSRFRSVSGRGSAITIQGNDSQYASYPICAFQQTKDPNYSVSLGCVWPTTSNPTNDCGLTYYPFTLNVTLLTDDRHWFKDAAGPEYTRVFVTRSSSAGGLATASGDEVLGPSDGQTCFRSRTYSNTSVAPLVYFNGGVPADLNCSSPNRSFAGCPFSCSLPEGCDASYGNTQNEFTLTGYRVNFDGQDTSQTIFDHYGATSAAGAPAGNWGYLDESGICVGGPWPGAKCDTDGQCTMRGNPGTCNNTFVVMRRNSYTADSLNIRRGENRRNSLVDGNVKLKLIDANNREIGLISRWVNADNYMAFVVREYGGDYVRMHRYHGGVYALLGSATPSINLLSWTRIGFKVRDNGSYVDGGFVPNGYCWMQGTVAGLVTLTLTNAYCAPTPYGNYGVFSAYNSSAQFYDLDAVSCTALGTCNR